MRVKKSQKSFFILFFKLESASGILLFLSAVFAVICANTYLAPYYALLLDVPVEIRIGALNISKPLLLWINDGFMAVFFLLVGLELKREFIEGELADRRNIVLPGIGALGGMVVPALIYVYLNHSDPVALKGWAIPVATDIAFALGILSLLGSRVPLSIKIFLTSLAIFDDIGAILIIAIFYTANISYPALLIVFFCLPVLVLMNSLGVTSKSFYLVIGIIMWVAMLKSGVHATLAGIVLALFVPLRSNTDPTQSPLKILERDLHTTVAFFILPIFAFTNAGINLSGIGFEQLFHSVPLGITLGLFFGKQIGVFGSCWLAVKLKLVRLPKEMSWKVLYGVAAICGVGFTMSLFLGSLAFEETNVNLLFGERLGIILGSLLSGSLGYLILHMCLKPRAEQSPVNSDEIKVEVSQQ